MIPLTCAAAAFVSSAGPALIPLRAWCAAAIVRAADAQRPDLDSTPFVCAAEHLLIPQPAATMDRES